MQYANDFPRWDGSNMIGNCCMDTSGGNSTVRQCNLDTTINTFVRLAYYMTAWVVRRYTSEAYCEMGGDAMLTSAIQINIQYHNDSNRSATLPINVIYTLIRFHSLHRQQVFPAMK
jgi:hypothetical protein